MTQNDVGALRGQLQTSGHLQLSVKVIPKSRQTAWAGVLADGSYKVKLHAVPEKGKANEELTRFLAEEFGIPRGNVRIVAGQTNPNKLVRLTR